MQNYKTAWHRAHHVGYDNGPSVKACFVLAYARPKLTGAALLRMGPHIAAGGSCQLAYARVQALLSSPWRTQLRSSVVWLSRVTLPNLQYLVECKRSLLLARGRRCKIYNSFLDLQRQSTLVEPIKLSSTYMYLFGVRYAKFYP
jgi:hypothetical protein